MDLPGSGGHLIVLSPAIAAAIAGLGQRMLGDKVAMAVTTVPLVVAAGLAGYAVLQPGVRRATKARRTPIRFSLARCIDVGTFVADWAIRIDTLSVVMLFVVTGVSSLVHVYSIGYMAEDPHRARFFSYLSFFTFAMLTLVTANDFLQLFFGWEGRGLASYLLIGFWYQKRSANDAAIKAFVVNRVGDFGFALGIMALVFVMQVPADFRARMASRLRLSRADRRRAILQRRLRHGVQHHRRTTLPVQPIGAGCGDADPAGDIRFPRPACLGARDHRRAAVHRRDGQVGAVLPAHLAAGRDGRPDAGLGADPRRDHGDRRRVHGLPLLRSLRAHASWRRT